jgi:hypothetical protein
VPHKPYWLQRIPEIVELLDTVEGEWLDRRAMEQAFGVSKMEACRLLGRFGAHRLGRQLLIRKQDAIRQLESLRQSGDYIEEAVRRERLVRDLEETRKVLVARQVRIPAACDVRDHRFADLPAGISLSPNRLAIEFYGIEDLMAKLFELSQAMANDPERLEAMLG